ncbi:DUF3139 domain-containing protein (plasmid) [Priestia aryabhattai]|uniref:DUF3139 domain-containing protein n=1 Tax=Priestia TaxID=2800373 RepID=UPI0011B6FE52|nr:DUF3139 domain-containing protein [Priestia megaterium]QDZ88374.1 DUF3139 domain-containing protein [Priestia megaterium]
MNKKIVWILVITIFIFMVPVSFLYLLSHGNPYTKYINNNHVPTHLNQKGYIKNDIKEMGYVEPKYLINKDFYHGHYMVIFKDEPNMTYYYGVTKRGKEVRQFCEKDVLLKDGVTDLTEDKTKHSEKKCVSSLKNRD